MANYNNNFSVTGNFEMDMMTITEEKKDIKVFDLRKVLNKFDGQKVKFSISFEEDDSEFLAENE